MVSSPSQVIRGGMHELWQETLLGSAGGLLVELVEFYNRLIAWRSRRRHRRTSRVAFREFFDVGPDIAVALTRAGLGAIAGLAFGAGGQVTGVYGLLAVGASAPVLLTQFGQVKSIRDALPTGDSSGLATAEGGNGLGVTADNSELERSHRETAHGS